MNNITTVFDVDTNVSLTKRTNEQKEDVEEKQNEFYKWFGNNTMKADIFVTFCIIVIIVGITLTVSYFIHGLSSWYLVSGLVLAALGVLGVIMTYDYTSLYKNIRKYYKEKSKR